MNNVVRSRLDRVVWPLVVIIAAVAIGLIVVSLFVATSTERMTDYEPEITDKVN
jgi:hypothetical protein